MPSKKEVKKANKKIVADNKITPLIQMEAMFFKELVDANNKYTGMIKQKAGFELALAQLHKHRKDIQTGEIKMPMTMTLIPNMIYYQEYDKKKMLKIFDDQIKGYTTNITSLNSQIEHSYEEFIETAVRNREFLTQRFGKAQAKHIAPSRKIIADEENLFEAEFENLMKDPEEVKKFKEANKEAVKRNTARKTKGK